MDYLVSTHVLERHTKPREPPLRILDAVRGPGRYTIFLAERGHRVSLVDLNPTLLPLARDRIAA